MDKKILEALNYFQSKSGATAVFIHLPEGVAYMLRNINNVFYNIIERDELDSLIETLKDRFVIQIIAERGENGEYILPDPDELEFEQEIDY